LVNKPPLASTVTSFKASTIKHYHEVHLLIDLHEYLLHL
jgi:hypothetical protein